MGDIQRLIVMLNIDPAELWRIVFNVMKSEDHEFY